MRTVDSSQRMSHYRRGKDEEEEEEESAGGGHPYYNEQDNVQEIYHVTMSSSSATNYASLQDDGACVVYDATQQQQMQRRRQQDPDGVTFTHSDSDPSVYTQQQQQQYYSTVHDDHHHDPHRLQQQQQQQHQRLDDEIETNHSSWSAASSGGIAAAGAVELRQYRVYHEQLHDNNDEEQVDEEIYTPNAMPASMTNYLALRDELQQQQQQQQHNPYGGGGSVNDALQSPPPPTASPSRTTRQKKHHHPQDVAARQLGGGGGGGRSSRNSNGGGGGGGSRRGGSSSRLGLGGSTSRESGCSSPRGRQGGGSVSGPSGGGGDGSVVESVLSNGGGNFGSNNQHRGFSTSIHDMFASIDDERVDCCALTCCGMLQNDRDRYLLQGITPPSLLRRFVLHVLFPLGMFGVAGYGALNIPDVYLNQFICTSMVLMIFYYLVSQCLKGRSKRLEVRKDLLWTKAQLQANRRRNLAILLEQERPQDDGDQEQDYYLGQRQRDFSCAHPCCLIGFYAEDRSPSRLLQQEQRQHQDEDDESLYYDNDDGYDYNDRNVASCLWNTLTPRVCGHHVQCCGFCALAQEAREIESALLPASYRRVDYLTMQAMSDYYPAIYQQRWQDELLQEEQVNEGAKAGIGKKKKRRRRLALSSFPKLSRLSIHLLQFIVFTFVVVLIWSFAGKYVFRDLLGLRVPEWRIFTIADFIIYVATWCQSFILLYILACMCNHPKATALSVDAMIKYFFAGFFLSVSLAVFWELFLGLFVKAIVSIFLALVGVHIVKDTNGYQESPTASGDYRGSGFGQAMLSNPLSTTASARHDDYLKSYGNEHPIFYTIYLLVASFLLAAFVEEVCKYFGYRMIEHPDFMTKQELDESMHVVHGERDTDQDTHASDEDHGYYEEQGRAQVIQRRQDKLQRRRQEQLKNDFSKQGRSVQAHGGAITLAMICVAMGFTCCENLVYIFIYSGSSFYMELFVLLSRALFPVHPIAAAIQSLGVVKRDVENSRQDSRLGRGILLPAVLFHGSYDFFILWIDYLVKRKGSYTDDDEKIATGEAFSFLLSLAIMGGAVLYYFIMARKQRDRLHAMDHQVAISGRSRFLK